MGPAVAAALVLAAVSSGTAAAALASSGNALTTPTTTQSVPVKAKPKPKPAKGSLKLYLPDVFFVNGNAVTVPARLLQLHGVVSPFVPGQWVTVRAFLGGRLIKSDKLRIKRSPNGKFGRFWDTVASPGVGSVVVIAEHSRTNQLRGFASRRSFAALDKNIGFGSLGRFVELIQQRLAALHFYIPLTGVYDQGTGLAIDAYHRLLGWGTYQTLDDATIRYLLNGWGAFKVRNPGDGTHAEGDLTNQLLALINGSNVYWILPISSGKPSTPTVLGHFNIYRRVPYFRPDGMYFSSYFFGGYAIHGYNPAPDYPASHGCMRLPMADAVDVYNWLNFGDAVDVYY